ncbi:MAG: Crp/Fnr family transcriptional regulator [Candidatus Firestonebacteria bacterium]
MIQNKNLDLLKKIPFFAEMTNKEFRIISDVILDKQYKENSYLFFENAKGNDLFIILSGLVRIYKSDSTGKVKTLAYLRSGDFFGEMSILDGEVRSASAQAMEDTHVYVIKGNDFKREIVNNPIVAWKIMKTLSKRLRDANKQIENLTFRNLPGRLANVLIDLSRKHGKKVSNGIRINLKLTHQDLADMVGTAREVVTTLMSAFKKANCIDMDKHYVTITNKEELSTWVT